MAYRATARTEQRKAELRARILLEARHCVARDGFRGLSIAAIANQSGIATGTLYRYFHSKADLCIAVFEDATEREIRAVEDAARTEVMQVKQLRQALNTFAGRALQNTTLAYALIAEPVDPELEQTRLRYRERWAQTFSTLLQHGIEQGLFYPQSVAVSAAALVGAMAEAIVISSSHPNPSQTPPPAAERCQQIVEFGLRAVVKPEALQ